MTQPDLPDQIGFMEYTGAEIGEYHGSQMADIINERDRRIEELEQECELLRHRIEVLGGQAADLEEAA